MRIITSDKSLKLDTIARTSDESLSMEMTSDESLNKDLQNQANLSEKQKRHRSPAVATYGDLCGLVDVGVSHLCGLVLSGHKCTYVAAGKTFALACLLIHATLRVSRWYTCACLQRVVLYLCIDEVIHHEL